MLTRRSFLVIFKERWKRRAKIQATSHTQGTALLELAVPWFLIPNRGMIRKSCEATQFRVVTKYKARGINLRRNLEDLSDENINIFFKDKII